MQFFFFDLIGGPNQLFGHASSFFCSKCKTPCKGVIFFFFKVAVCNSSMGLDCADKEVVLVILLAVVEVVLAVVGVV